LRRRRRFDFNLTPREARAVQERCAGLVDLETGLDVRRFLRAGRLAAVDVAYDARRDICFAALVVWDVGRGEAIDGWSRAAPSTFPYVPGLLSFRELPPLIPLFRRLRAPIDLLLCDGQGLAHPRRFGLASHLGVLYDLPSLGWAKSRLIGEHEEPGIEARGATPLIDRGERIGWALRSRARCNPTFVSPGHRVSMRDALRIARGLIGPHRLPEPARAAHAMTVEAMREVSLSQ
jgi:deoxyribonuclease V